MEKKFIFNDRERAKFLKLAKDYALFSGFELVSWCLMSNHFHLLVRVPVQDVEAISDKELVERLAHILSPNRLSRITTRLNGTSDAEERRSILDSFRKRIGHLPSYVKAVKQDFTQWFNFVNQREGTLWEGRYHSTIIEDCGGENPEHTFNGSGEIARIVASYIDMNPVRAKVESDPKDCDWSSYGAALRGDPTALRGLRLLWGNPEGEENLESAPAEARDFDKYHLATHRRWILRTVDAGELTESSAQELPQPDNRGNKKRGRPPRLTGLRRIRVLGSPQFFARIGVVV